MLTRLESSAAPRPIGPYAQAIAVRDRTARWNPHLGTLEWIEGGVIVSLTSRTLGVEDLVAIAETMKKVEDGLAGQGRLLVRYSGTEPLLRIMLEGKDDGEITQWANDIADVVREQLA